MNANERKQIATTGVTTKTIYQVKEIHAKKKNVYQNMLSLIHI